MRIRQSRLSNPWKYSGMAVLIGAALVLVGQQPLSSAPTPVTPANAVTAYTGNRAPQTEQTPQRTDEVVSPGDLGMTPDDGSVLAELDGCIPGDADGSGTVTFGDAIYLSTYLYGGGPAPLCTTEGCGGVNCDDVGALTRIIDHVIYAGPPPVSCGLGSHQSQGHDGGTTPDQTSIASTNSVLIESKSVPSGATNVQVGVFVTNDFELRGLVLPLQLRSLTPGSYIESASFSLTVQGRVASSHLMDFAGAEYFDLDNFGGCFQGGESTPSGFGVSPDAFHWYGFSLSGGMSAGSDGSPGSGTPSFLLEFDINSTPGQFIIDTACTGPGNVLRFADASNCVLPSFTPGIVTINCDWSGCAPGSIPEGEPCSQTDDTFNGGCNSTPPVFSTIESGDTVCGTLWADTGWRDTDWYRFYLESQDSVIWRGTANLPFAVAIISIDGQCDFTNDLTFVTAAGCDTVEASLLLPAGQYAAWIGSSGFENYPCNTGPWEYEATFELRDGNRRYEEVVIWSTSAVVGAADVEVPISISSSIDPQHVYVPLVARSVSGGAFWEGTVDTLPFENSGALFLNRSVDFSQIDFASPDPVTLSIEGFVGLCPGPFSMQQVTGLKFDVNNSPGQFEIDTAASSPAGAIRFVECNSLFEFKPRFTKGVVTILPPPNNVVVESKTVTAGETDVEVAISIANSVDLQGISLLLQVTSLSGGAFWSTQVDSLPRQGRLAASTNFISILDLDNLDFTSPDAVGLYYTLLPPCVDTGPLEQMTGLRFDVNNNPGQFEIDSTFIPPAGHLSLEGCGVGAIVPAFTKGIITIEAPIGGNYVRIESKQVDPGATNVPLEVSIANDVDLQSFVLPLVARSLSGGAFWSGNCDTLPAHGRMAGTMEDVRVFNTSQLNYTDPDQVLIVGLELFPPLNCMSSGFLEGVTGLTFDVGTNEGQFEIDTMLFPSSNVLVFGQCDPFLEIVPTFEKGIITVGNPPLCACDCHGDPVCEGVPDVFDVIACVDEAFRNGSPLVDPNGACPASSDNDVADCNDLVDVFDVVNMVDVAFRNGDPNVIFCKPCP